MLVHSSQTRENIEDAEYRVIKWNDESVILEDSIGNWSLWYSNDNYSGYVIVINGIGYEFVESYN